jgi:NAD(P)-dependent dehydrogenase (short-subunit alcohol dehydrogenase family)
MELAGKTALVTGSSRGIGRATALALARAGARVVVTGLEPELIAETVELLRRETSQEALALAADLSRREEVRRLAQATLDHFDGQLDILVNNAGMSIVEPTEAVGEATMDHQIGVNFVAPLMLSQLAAPAMAARGGGRIVFLSSTGATAAHSQTAIYDSMKAGLEALTRCLAVEWGPRQILVNAVEPGHIVVELEGLPAAPSGALRAHWEAIPVGRPGLPEEVAETILFLASPRNSYISGAVLRIDGGRTARTPVIVRPADG